MRKNVPFLIGSASLLALTACVEPGGFSEDDPNRNAKQGAIAGAAVGAIVGAATAGSNTGKSAAVGALVGAGAGALIGNQLDQQAAELRNSLGDDVRIVRQGDQLIVTMPQDILFAVDSASLTGSLRGDLATLASSLNDYPNTTVDVIGHTDNTGDASYNQNLSARRAEAVAGVLRANGVAGFRIRAFGRGEDEPVASNLTPEGRQLNRRVDIIIRPNA